MSNNSLAFTPAVELAALIRTKKLSPVELVELMLSRIHDFNPRLNAYLTLAEDEARASARQAENAVMAGGELPPLHGVPVSIKDLCFTKGLRTTGGSLAYKDYVPDEDAVAVERLKAAGAIVLGKTNTPEFGQSTTTENNLGDDCRNPWDTTRTTGGSTGGGAASVAAGMGPLAVGSDGGGSIRIPASYCGVFGLKPTFGRVPAHGGFGGMPMFSHTGPLARTVRDAALMLNVMAGFDERDPVSIRGQAPDFLAGLEARPRPLRIAWSPDLGFAAIDPEVRAAAAAAAKGFASLGFAVDDATPEFDSPFALFGTIVLADEFAATGHLLESHVDQLMPYVKATLERGRQTPAFEYSRALRSLEKFRMQMANFFDKYDLLLTPTTAVPAFPLRQRPRVIDGVEVTTLWGATPLCMPFNLTHQPAASVPCGFSSSGMPIGLQVVGRWGEETTVLQACAAYEAAHPWADKTPAGF